MNGVTTTFQMVNVAVFIMTLAVCFYGFRRHREYRGAFLPSAMVSAIGVVFYTFLLAGRLNNDQVLLFGAAHRTLMGLVIFGGMLAMVWALGGPA